MHYKGGHEGQFGILHLIIIIAVLFAQVVRDSPIDDYTTNVNIVD